MAVSELFSLAEQGAPQAVRGWLPSYLWLEIDTLAASACTCQYEQTQELFSASHMIRVDGINGIKILQCSQCHIQSEENAAAVS